MPRGIPLRKGGPPSDSRGRGRDSPRALHTHPLFCGGQALPVTLPVTQGWPHFDLQLPLHCSHQAGVFQKLSRGDVPPLKSWESPAKGCSGVRRLPGQAAGAVVSPVPDLEHRDIKGEGGAETEDE